MDSVGEAVRDQYARYPFPSLYHAQMRALERLPGLLRRPLVRRLERRVLTGLGMRRLVEPLFPGGLAGKRVLDVGCGTGELTTGLAACYPDADVTGVDLSPASVRLARDLAARLSVRNVAFEEGDLLALSARAPHDLVVANGVLHHLASPADGLRALVPHLRPGGLLLVYLYGAIGRFDRILKQEALALLVPDAARFEDKLQLVRELGLFPPRRLDPLRAAKRWLLRDLPAEEIASVVVDQCAHVQEANYTVAEVLRLLDATGLELVRFVDGMPDAIEDVTTSPRVRARAAQLGPLERYRLIELLTRPDHYTFGARPKRRPPAA